MVLLYKIVIQCLVSITWMREITWLLHDKYNGIKTSEFFKDLERLKGGEPIDYIIGYTPFLGCHIDVSKKPLIPRPETEYWVEKAIGEIVRSSPKISSTHSKTKPSYIKSPLQCLDLFAGSGCIGIAILNHFPYIQVDFGEKYKKCISQIKINITQNKIQPLRAHVIQTNCFSRVKKQYNYIFANPPYIDASNTTRTQKSVLDWEPHEALFAKNNGMYYISKLLTTAPQYLLHNGRMYIEFDPPQKRKIEKVLSSLKYREFDFWKDQHNKWRVVIVKK